jgi:hypothetical protein
MTTTSIQGGSVSLSTGQSLEAAINRVNAAWAKPEQIYTNQVTSRIAYFSYEAGDREEFYMRVDGQSDADKGDTETRNFGEPQGVKVASVGFKRVDIMAELLPMFTNRDPMKLFLGPTEEGVLKALRLPTRRMALLLRSGFTATCLWDGLSYFNANHKVNPADAQNKGVFANYFTGFKNTEDGWAGFLDLYEQVPGANDYLINQGFAESGPVIWTPNRIGAKKFMKYFDPDGRIYVGNLAQDRGAGNTETAAAAETTVFKPMNGYRLPTIEVVPELVDSNTAASRKRHFVFNTRYPMRRAAVVRIPRTMQMRINRTDSNPYAATNNAYPVWADMDFGIDFGLPHLCACLEEA